MAENDTIAAMNSLNQALGTVATVSGHRSQQKRAFRYQQQAMELQSDLWKKNTEWLTEYNSPENQIRRYREAGINPNFVYGQVNAGASSGQNPTASSPYDVQKEQAQFAQAMGKITDIVPMFQAAVKAQQDLERGEVAKAMDVQRLRSMETENKYNEDYLRTRNETAALDFLFKQGTDDDRRAIVNYNRQKAQHDLAESMAEAKRKQVRFDQWEKNLPLEELLTKARIGSMNASASLNRYYGQMLEKYGVKTLGDMSFGGLLLQVLDSSGVLPDLINWLSGQTAEAAGGVDSGAKSGSRVMRVLSNPVNDGNGYTAGFNIFGY